MPEAAFQVTGLEPAAHGAHSLATWDRTLEQLLPALETSEVPV